MIEWKRMEHVWNYTDRSELTCSEEHTSQCSFVHHKYHTKSKLMIRLINKFWMVGFISFVPVCGWSVYNGWFFFSNLFHLYQFVAEVYIMGGFFFKFISFVPVCGWSVYNGWFFFFKFHRRYPLILYLSVCWLLLWLTIIWMILSELEHAVAQLV